MNLLVLDPHARARLGEGAGEDLRRPMLAVRAGRTLELGQPVQDLDDVRS
jgi:hypothetical protein